MASLQIPLAIWKGFLNFDVTCILHDEEGETLFLGLSSGHIVRLFFNSITAEIQYQGLFAGHHQPIYGFSLTTIPNSDGPGSIPALLSLDRGGALALWSLPDARCLLFNLAAMEGEARGLLAWPTSNVKSTPQYCESIFLYGHTNFITILRAATLEVVQSIPLPHPIGVIPWARQALLLRDKALLWNWLVVLPVVGQQLSVCSIDGTSGKATSPFDYFTLTMASGLDISAVVPGGNSFSSDIGSHNPPVMSEIRLMETDEMGQFIYLTNGYYLWKGELVPENKQLVCTIVWTEHNDPITQITSIPRDGGVMIETASGSLMVLDAPNPLRLHPSHLPTSLISDSYLTLPLRSGSCSILEFHDFHQQRPSACKILVHSLENEQWKTRENVLFSDVRGISCLLPAVSLDNQVNAIPDGQECFTGYLDGSIRKTLTFSGVLIENGRNKDDSSLPTNQASDHEDQPSNLNELWTISGAMNPSYRHSITCFYQSPHRSGLLVVGDRKGFIASGKNDQRISHHSYHIAPIIGILPLEHTLQHDRLLIVDESGRCSLSRLENETGKLNFERFLGFYTVPLRSIRSNNHNHNNSSSEDDSYRLLLHYQDEHYEIWDLKGGGACTNQGRTHDPSTIGGGSFTLLANWLTPRKGLPVQAIPSPVLPLLGSSLAWRLTRPHDPFLIMILDVRKLLERIHEISSLVDIFQQLRVHLALILSWLMPWGWDQDLDELSKKLGMAPPYPDVSVGMMGANGNIAFSRNATANGKLNSQNYYYWQQSPTMTATLYLTISSILELSLDLGEEWDRLRMWFSSKWWEAWDPHLRPLPSFAFVSKYWHDLGEEIRHASRLTIVQTLARLTLVDLQHIADYWTTYLPAPVMTIANTSVTDSANSIHHSNASGDWHRPALESTTSTATTLLSGGGTGGGGGRKIMNRAAIILGILALHHPQLLSSSRLQLVADALVTLMMDERRILFRAAAIELIGKGFRVWEGHLQALAVFRLLLGWLASLGQIEEVPASTVVNNTTGNINGGMLVPPRSDSPGMGKVAHLVVPFENAATLDTLEVVRTTLMRLVGAAPSEILPSWLVHDIPTYRGLVEKWTSVSVLSDLIRQRPGIIKSYVGMVAELLSKLVEQGNSVVGGSKSRMTGIIGPILNDLVATFPTVAYHREVHRLVAAPHHFTGTGTTGTVSRHKDATANTSTSGDYRMVLVDTRGGSTVRSLEGHTHPVTCLIFTPDGRQIISYSADEATLRWWPVSSGPFSSLLGGVIKPSRTEVVEASLTEAVLAYRQRNFSHYIGTFDSYKDNDSSNNEENEVIDNIWMKWTGPTTLHILVDDRLTSIITINND